MQRAARRGWGSAQPSQFATRGLAARGDRSRSTGRAVFALSTILPQGPYVGSAEEEEVRVIPPCRGASLVLCPVPELMNSGNHTWPLGRPSGSWRRFGGPRRTASGWAVRSEGPVLARGKSGGEPDCRFTLCADPHHSQPSVARSRTPVHVGAVHFVTVPSNARL